MEPPGTTAWWWRKIPFLLVNLALLIPIVKRVAPIEQRALLAGTTRWRWGIGSMLVVAAILSASIKAWSSPQAGVLIAGMAGTPRRVVPDAQGRPPVSPGVTRGWRH